MRPKSLRKAVIALANSDISESDMHDVLRGFERVGINRLIDTIREIRFRTDQITQDMLDHEVAFGNSASPERRIVDDIVRLLIEEAHLSASEAAKRLEQQSPQILPSFRPKEGFKRWLERVVVFVSPSELLHQATRIRNSLVHGVTTNDWPLKDRGK